MQGDEKLGVGQLEGAYQLKLDRLIAVSATGKIGAFAQRNFFGKPMLLVPNPVDAVPWYSFPSSVVAPVQIIILR